MHSAFKHKSGRELPRSGGSMQCNAMQCSAMQCNAMQCNEIQYNTIQYNTIQYNTIQYSTVQYSTVQYNTIQYNTIQYNTIQYNTIHTIWYDTIRYATVPSNTKRSWTNARLKHHPAWSLWQVTLDLQRNDLVCELACLREKYHRLVWENHQPVHIVPSHPNLHQNCLRMSHTLLRFCSLPSCVDATALCCETAANLSTSFGTGLRLETEQRWESSADKNNAR